APPCVTFDAALRHALRGRATAADGSLPPASRPLGARLHCRPAVRIDERSFRDCRRASDVVPVAQRGAVAGPPPLPARSRCRHVLGSQLAAAPLARSRTMRRGSTVETTAVLSRCIASPFAASFNLASSPVASRLSTTFCVSAEEHLGLGVARQVDGLQRLRG